MEGKFKMECKVKKRKQESHYRNRQRGRWNEEFDPRDYYEVRVSSRKKSRKFKVDSNTYHVDFKNVSEDITPDDLLDGISGMLERLVEDVKRDCKAHQDDQLRINIHHPSFQ